MQIALDAELESRLNQEAASRGLTPAAFVESIVIDRLLFTAANRANWDLIQQWQREGVTEADPEAIRQCRAEAQEFFLELARDRGYAEADAQAFAAAAVATS